MTRLIKLPGAGFKHGESEMFRIGNHKTKVHGIKKFEDAEAAYLLVWGCVLAFSCTFFLSNFDCEAVTKWGYGLLECIRQGELADFPRFVMEQYNSPTNYTLFVNLVTAVWLTPAYLIGRVFLHSSSLLFYEVWYKALVGIVLLLDVKFFGEVLEERGFKRKERQIGCGLFLLSGVTLLAVLGKGQVDIYGLLFFLYAAKLYHKEKYGRMSVLLGMSFVVKPLVLWVYLPFLLLLAGKEKLRVLLYGGISFVPFLLDKLVTRLLMPEYMALGKEVARRMKEYFGGPSMFESMFECGVNDVLVFWFLALVVCFICYYLAMHGKVKEWHFCFFPPLLLVLWGVFVCVSYQWFIYVVPFFIVMALQYKKRSDAYLLVLGINGGLAGYFMVAETMYVLPTLSGNIDGRVGEADSVVMQVLQSLRPYIFPAGKTLFFTAMLVCAGLFAVECMLRKEMTKVGENGEEENVKEEGLFLPGYEKILFCLQPLPVAAYLAVVAFVCIRG